jgi:hypothetical protein
MIENTISVQTLQNQLYQEIKNLSSKNMAELLNFVNYLKYRDSLVCTKEPVKLEGLWEAIPFEVTDEDVRVLRQQFTQQIEGHVNATN